LAFISQIEAETAVVILAKIVKITPRLLCAARGSITEYGREKILAFRARTAVRAGKPRIAQVRADSGKREDKPDADACGDTNDAAFFSRRRRPFCYEEDHGVLDFFASLMSCLCNADVIRGKGNKKRIKRWATVMWRRGSDFSPNRAGILFFFIFQFQL
jgi:hypothetical protein